MELADYYYNNGDFEQAKLYLEKIYKNPIWKVATAVKVASDHGADGSPTNVSRILARSYTTCFVRLSLLAFF